MDTFILIKFLIMFIVFREGILETAATTNVTPEHEPVTEPEPETGLHESWPEPEGLIPDGGEMWPPDDLPMDRNHPDSETEPEVEGSSTQANVGHDDKEHPLAMWHIVLIASGVFCVVAAVLIAVVIVVRQTFLKSYALDKEIPPGPTVVQTVHPDHPCPPCPGGFIENRVSVSSLTGETTKRNSNYYITTEP